VRLATILAFIIALGAGCAAMATLGVVDSEQDKYTYWTRYYEARMGLPPTKILFEAHPTKSWCSWVDAEVEMTGDGVVPVRSVVHYDIERSGCEKPWTTTRHEMLHLRLMHPYYRMSTNAQIDQALKEAEVAAHWMEWYR